jgi:hypothetical protein
MSLVSSRKTMMSPVSFKAISVDFITQFETVVVDVKNEFDAVVVDATGNLSL